MNLIIAGKFNAVRNCFYNMAHSIIKFIHIHSETSPITANSDRTKMAKMEKKFAFSFEQFFGLICAPVSSRFAFKGHNSVQLLGSLFLFRPVCARTQSCNAFLASYRLPECLMCATFCCTSLK